MRVKYVEDEMLCTVQVGLEAVLERCERATDGQPLDMQADWASLLSLGEQQRLAFARVLLANPALVLLDESTSALDLANEARLYRLLLDRGMAFISVGHRDSLREFHSTVLRLEGPKDAEVERNWTLQSVKPAMAEGAKA
jgi:ABC-type uncharacterized transport system fused permease/ATPase subunit